MVVTWSTGFSFVLPSFEFAPPVWTHISSAAKDLITHMLDVNPQRRYSVDTCLRHPWFGVVEPPRALLPAAPALPIAIDGVVPPLLITGVTDGVESLSSSTSSLPSSSPSASSSALATSAATAPSRQMFQLVAKCLDLERINYLQKEIARAFESAYTSSVCASVPEFAAVLRRHAVACRDLHMRVRKVMLHFHTTAQSVVELIPELKHAIVRGNVDLTQGLYGKLKAWVQELKAGIAAVQDSYSQVTCLEMHLGVLLPRSGRWCRRWDCEMWSCLVCDDSRPGVAHPSGDP